MSENTNGEPYFLYLYVNREQCRKQTNERKRQKKNDDYKSIYHLMTFLKSYKLKTIYYIKVIMAWIYEYVVCGEPLH